MFDKDPHFLRLERLEQDGVLMKSGLTPTDIMVIKGDFDRYYDKAGPADYGMYECQSSYGERGHSGCCL